MKKSHNNSYLVLLFVSIAGCQPGIVLEPRSPATQSDLKTSLGIDDIPYVRDDTFIGNPLALLGQVVEVRKQNGACTTAFEGNSSFSVAPMTGFQIDESTILRAPSKRDSKIVNQQVAGTISFLSTFSAELDSKSVFSIVVFDQAGGRLKDSDASWSESITQWHSSHTDLWDSPEICYLMAVKGVIQKNIIRRKFTEIAGKASGNAYGINVGGKYLTSDEDYAIDVKFGLSLGVLKRPPSPDSVRTTGDTPTEAEQKAVSSLRSIARPRRP